MVAEQGLVVSLNGRKEVVVSEIQDHFDIPEYPMTQVDGILHFVHLKSTFKRTNPLSIRPILSQYISKIQFGMSQVDQINSTTIKILAKNRKDEYAKGFHQSFKCSGIKHCEYAREVAL
ncbi:hypothetical protein N7G274_009290 [Stereocaulon virgatum]|uniref:Uncharacterized protein n=1 Tax=Stereocaulon virgatum TaxID=373712 RepID=A0ABR3ZZ35_9LECA